MTDRQESVQAVVGIRDKLTATSSIGGGLMAHVSTTYESFKSKVVSDSSGGNVGECVSYVKRACPSLSATSTWKKGLQVKCAGRVQKGTAIATFSDTTDQYKGHAAIYVSHTASGIQVWDQWVGHPVAPRTIAFRGGKGYVSNDGDQFFVVD